MVWKATFCEENHSTSGHMVWECHVGSSGQAGTFMDPYFRMMRGFFQVEDLTQDEDINGPVLDRKMEVHRLTHNQWQRLRTLFAIRAHLPLRPDT